MLITPGQRQIFGFGAIALGALIALGSIALLLTQDSGDSSAPADGESATATEAPSASPTPASTVEATTPTATATPTATPPPTVTQTATPTAEPTAVTFSEADIETFLADLRTAGAESDIDSLMAWLHPAVLERYGEDVCRTYLETTELALDVTVREVAEPAPWDWLTNDGEAGRFEEALEIEIARLVNSQTLVQLLHLVPLDGELKWLTDCGDPAS